MDKLKKRGIKVLSLFDGIGTGRLALERANIPVDIYYASEIEKSSIKIAVSNFPNIVQLGSVLDYNSWGIPWEEIDLLIGGSPCQSFSSAGKRKGFDGESKLFYIYRDILNHLKNKNPNIKFLLENVVMKKEWEDIITKELGGVSPITINSSLLSAQNRKRNYWFNWGIPSLPENKNIKLKDILEFKNDGYTYKATIVGRRINKEGHREDYNRDIPITQCLEVRKSNCDKANCLTTVEKDNVLSKLPYGRYIGAFTKELKSNWRYYTLTELCRLQTLPDDYCKNSGVSESISKKAIGNGWTCDIVAYILRFMDDGLPYKDSTRGKKEIAKSLI